MKVLFAWHAAVEPQYRKLFPEIAAQGIDLVALVPTAWTEGGRLLQVRPSVSEEGYQIEALTVLGRDLVKRFFYPNIPRLALLMKEFAPDVLHLFEEPYSLCANQLLSMKRLFAPKAKTVIHTFENLDMDHGWPFSALERFCFRYADAIISVPAEGVEVLRRKGYRGPISIIPMGLDEEQFFRREDPYGKLAFLGEEALNFLQEPGFKIAYVGRLTPEKGVDLLIRAVALLMQDERNCRLFIAGGGLLKEELEGLVREVGIGDCTLFAGPMESATLPAFLSCMDVLVLPSRTMKRWKEQFGRVLVEAMACGVPVVGSSSGEIPRVIGGAGLIFAEGDERDLKDKLDLLIRNNDLRKVLAAEGRRRVLEKFTHKKVAAAIVECYKEMLS